MGKSQARVSSTRILRLDCFIDLIGKVDERRGTRLAFEIHVVLDSVVDISGVEQSDHVQSIADVCLAHTSSCWVGGDVEVVTPGATCERFRSCDEISRSTT